MSFKDILVHLDAGERDAARLDVAFDLARRLDGRVTGLFARLEHHAPALVARRESAAMAETADATEAAFLSLAAEARVAHRFWRLTHGDSGAVLAETAFYARFTDLVVMGQHRDDLGTPADLIEEVLLQSGRPCLIIPALGDHPAVGRTAVVAWNAGREAARALHDALPLLRPDAHIHVLSIRATNRHDDGPPQTPVDICEHLTAHGYTVSRENLGGEEIGDMDLILSRAVDLGADLLVAGAYGGTQLPFFKSGGTRHLLRHMTLPILMAH